MMYRVDRSLACCIPHGGRSWPLGTDAPDVDKVSRRAIMNPMDSNDLNSKIKRFHIYLPDLVEIFLRNCVGVLTQMNEASTVNHSVWMGDEGLL